MKTRYCNNPACGEPLNPDNNRIYCDDTCMKMTYRLKRREEKGTHPDVGSYILCPVCGEPFKKKRNNHNHCSPRCYDISTGKLIPDVTFTCQVCGKEQPREGKGSGRQRVCRDKCESDGSKIECPRCGEKKEYSEFYDYRDQEGRGFVPACRDCHTKGATLVYHNTKVLKGGQHALTTGKFKSRKSLRNAVIRFSNQGLTQQKIAKKVEVSQMTVSNILRSLTEQEVGA